MTNESKYYKVTHPPKITHPDNEPHADFSYRIIKNEAGSFIEIVELKGSRKSVKDDMAYVISTIENYCNDTSCKGIYIPDFKLSDFKIIYKDSDDIYDGIKIENEKFSRFYPIREKCLNEAMEKAT